MVTGAVGAAWTAPMVYDSFASPASAAGTCPEPIEEEGPASGQLNVPENCRVEFELIGGGGGGQNSYCGGSGMKVTGTINRKPVDTRSIGRPPVAVAVAALIAVQAARAMAEPRAPDTSPVALVVHLLARIRLAVAVAVAGPPRSTRRRISTCTPQVEPGRVAEEKVIPPDMGTATYQQHRPTST